MKVIFLLAVRVAPPVVAFTRVAAVRGVPVARADGEVLIVVLAVLQHTQHDLLDVRQARALSRLLACLGEHREQNRGQDGDDCDHDQ